MIVYTVSGRAMTLSLETSRACGYLSEFDGEMTPDGSAAVRREVLHDAQVLADQLGKSVEVYAHHPSAQDWTVEVVEPS